MKIVKKRQMLGLDGKVKRDVSAAMLLWGQAVASHAQAHAPIESGALRRAIVVSSVMPSANGLRIAVGPDSTVSAYAARQEFDTSLGFGPISSAEGATRPWLRPAALAMAALGRILVINAFKRALK